MEPIRESYIDKSKWPQGPWQSEPDKMEWRYKGVPCLIVRGPMGALCGYAAVESKHPWYGKEYSGCLLEGCKEKYCSDHQSPSSMIDVHGGLTFSSFCQEGGKICHVPLPGEEDKAWWFGFDCAHSGDFCPQYMKRGFFEFPLIYADLNYVKSQVHKKDDR